MTAPPTAYEQELLERAAAWAEHPCWKNLTVPVLLDIAGREGHDFAVALVYDRLLRSAEHGPFIRKVQSVPLTQECHQAPAMLAIVPGACYVEYPQTGADGRRVRECAEHAGWRVEMIPVASFGALEANAQIICDWLRQRRHEPMVLVSLSKGGADVRAALVRREAKEAFANVRAWISLSGIVHGTPLVRWVQGSLLRSLSIRLLCWYRGYSLAILQSLDAGADSPLAADLEALPGLNIVHVVGLCLSCHRTSKRSRLGYQRLTELGPNDAGGLLLGQLCRLPGRIYPIWGADHYLEPGWDVRPLIRQIVCAAAC